MREIAIQERKSDAEIQEIMARAVQIGVQAAYSAMQGGAQVATMPQIAPIADAIMAGAGYQKPNPMGDDPNFPTPTQAAAVQMKDPYIQGEGRPDENGQAPAVKQNTSPAFPPVPQDGASPMQGIETPTTADNLPEATA